MNLSANSLNRKLAFIALVIFLLIGTFGLGNAGMQMNEAGQMSGCPFMGMSAVCQMSPFEHIAAWQNMFTATTGESTFVLLFILLVAVIFFAYSTSKRIYPDIRVALKHRPPNIFFFKNPLQEAFSNGILNSKVF